LRPRTEWFSSGDLSQLGQDRFTIDQFFYDLRHCWKTRAIGSGLHPLIANAVVGHGDRKKDVKSLYLTINDEDLVSEIDRLTFDHGKTEIWGQK
jgi:hypothetical protein